MRRIINSTYISVDGVVDNMQNWPSLKSAEEHDAVQAELLLACDGVLMGRRTYDSFAPVWPTRSGDPVSDRINTMPKYVVSSSLKDPEWANTTVIDGDVAGEIARLKEQPGQDIVQYGIGDVTRLMLEHGLLDEFRLWVHPFLVGGGQPSDLMFRDGSPARLELLGTRTLSNGIVILSYEVQAAAAA